MASIPPKLADYGSGAPPPGRPPGRLTMVLLVVNGLIFLWQRQLSFPAFAHFQHMYALNPATSGQHGLWQFLTYQFLHGSLLHLGANLMVLHSIGPVLEEALGEASWLALYLFSGAFGGVVQWVGARLLPDLFSHPVVGASASIFGLLAALCALYPEEPMEACIFFVIPVKMRAKFLLLAAALISLIGVVFPFGNVAHLAHLGGLLGGLVGLNLIRAARPRDFESPR